MKIKNYLKVKDLLAERLKDPVQAGYIADAIFMALEYSEEEYEERFTNKRISVQLVNPLRP